uniref:Maestro/Maestro-like HEAT-repeats domain-containing protein n=1 Tax=Plectus sambesii TaxID=2011161 RepID=A0A914XDG9_9BILA
MSYSTALGVAWVQNGDRFPTELSSSLFLVFLGALAFPDRVNYYALCCNNYFKSGSSRIRANAAYLTGYLLGGLPSDLRSTISKELIFVGLALLLKEPEVEVKVATADAIACLHAYY